MWRNNIIIKFSAVAITNWIIIHWKFQNSIFFQFCLIWLKYKIQRNKDANAIEHWSEDFWRFRIYNVQNIVVSTLQPILKLPPLWNVKLSRIILSFLQTVWVVPSILPSDHTGHRSSGGVEHSSHCWEVLILFLCDDSLRFLSRIRMNIFSVLSKLVRQSCQGENLLANLDSAHWITDYIITLYYYYWLAFNSTTLQWSCQTVKVDLFSV